MKRVDNSRWPVYVIAVLIILFLLYFFVSFVFFTPTTPERGFSVYEGFIHDHNANYSFVLNEDLRCYLNEDLVLDEDIELAIRGIKSKDLAVYYVFGVKPLRCVGCFDFYVKKDTDPAFYLIEVRNYTLVNKEVLEKEFFPEIIVESGNIEPGVEVYG